MDDQLTTQPTAPEGASGHVPPSPRLAPGALLPGEVEVGRLLASHGSKNIYTGEDFGGTVTILEQAAVPGRDLPSSHTLTELLPDWPTLTHKDGRDYAIFRGKPGLCLRNLELICEEEIVADFLLRCLEALLVLSETGLDTTDLGPDDVYLDEGQPTFLVFPRGTEAQHPPADAIQRIVRQVLFHSLLPKTTRNLEAPLGCLGLTLDMEQALTRYLEDNDWASLLAWLRARCAEPAPCWEVYGLTHTGLVRDHNEDALGWQLGQLHTHHRRSQTCILAVSDGMGGHQLGEEASHLALMTFFDLHGSALRRQDLQGRARERLVAEAFDGAAEAVRDAFQHMRHDNRPGATLVAGHISGRRLYLGNCGDSRAYLYCNDALRQVTIDHSLIQLYVDRGILTPEEAENTDNSVITSFIGMEEKSYRRDVFSLHLPPGAWLLLCSDGLTDMVRAPRIAELLAQAANVNQAAESLVAEALANGGHDNITVLVLHDQAGLFHNVDWETDEITDPAPRRA